VRLIFTSQAWEDYLHWQATDERVVRRIHELVKDTLRHPFTGIGKPEPLRFTLAGLWSRRIDSTHRMVYKVEKNDLMIVQLRYHY
jgi:toxin YoeB